MSLSKLLIANRGEIAIRVARAAAELDIPTVAVYSSDDAASLHVRAADESCPLEGVGAAAYLDIEGVVAAAKAAGCDALHPGYASWPRTPASRGAARRRASSSSGPASSRWSSSATRPAPARWPRRTTCRCCPAAPAP